MNKEQFNTNCFEVLNKYKDTAITAINQYTLVAKTMTEDLLKKLNFDEMIRDVANDNVGTLHIRMANSYRVTDRYVSNPLTLIFKTTINGNENYEYEVGSFGRNIQDWNRLVLQLQRRFVLLKKLEK